MVAQPNEILAALGRLSGIALDRGRDRLAHSLSVATAAWNDGRPDGYVIAALLHHLDEDRGAAPGARAAELLAGHIAAADLQWLRWLPSLQVHPPAAPPDACVGLDRAGGLYLHARDFATRYDAPSWDDGASALPLADFVPMLERVCAARVNAR